MNLEALGIKIIVGSLCSGIVGFSVGVLCLGLHLLKLTWFK